MSCGSIKDKKIRLVENGSTKHRDLDIFVLEFSKLYDIIQTRTTVLGKINSKLKNILVNALSIAFVNNI